jgi:hypothetical protein
MSKHTPGPWKANNKDEIRNDDNDLIATAWDIHVKREEDGLITLLPNNSKANARLMAAAPELLEALKELYNASLVMEQPRFYKALAEAKKVIAKIEGDE